jgi:putative membrane protein
MKRPFLPLFAAALLALASCGNSTENKGGMAANGSATDSTTTAAPADATATAMPDTAGSNMATGDPNGPTAPHATDKEFMESAAHSDQNEIQQSKMALAKGVTGPVKEHAEKMIADHTKSTADLKAIATKKGITLPTDMDAEHKAMAPAMEKLSGQAFADKYMAQMVTDHQKTANTLMAHEKMTQDADLKGFIGKTLPVVQQHLANAEKHSDMKM